MKKKWLMALLLVIPVFSAGAGIMVVGSLTHEKTCHAGEVYQGEFVIRNTGGEEEEVRIYQTDYRFSCDGTSEYGEPGSEKRSNAAWIEYSPQRFRLPPRESRTVQYRITVPGTGLKDGTYWSILMVESVPQIDPATLETKSVGIRTVMRYGIQMISHMGESGVRQIRFINTELRSETGEKMLDVDIENTGERMVRPFVWVELFGEDGTRAGIFESKACRIYPETSVRHRIVLKNVKAGIYKALVVADCGDDDLFGIQYTLQVDQ